jgi:5-methylcytosine-specific restriction endonuclease McrA
MSYLRARKLSLEEVLPEIDQCVRKHKSLTFKCDNRKITVHLSSSRIRLIGRTQVCAACQIQGDHFWIEANSIGPDNKHYGWHLNLYALNHYGHPIMMTLDHIVPKSKGGTKAPNNIQLLCTHCNNAKEDKPLSVEEIAVIRSEKDPILRQLLEDAGVI